MVEKKFIKVLACVFLVSTLGACSNGASSKNSNSKDSSKKIGITQIVEHPALDSARKGFIEALKEEGFEEGKNIKIDLQNAQGDISVADTIAKKFVSDKKDLIFAISTSSAQAAYNSTKNIPIVITAITDPVEAGIIKSMEKSQTNVTGTSDRTPIKKQLELLKKVKGDIKKLGVIFSTSEVNSRIQVDELKKEASKFGIEIIEGGVTSVNEVPQVLASILGQVDALYTPADNMVASALTIITKSALDKNIIVFGAEKAHVEMGALITLGVDYKELGKETGKKAVEILKGKKPSEIPVTMQKKFKVAINENTIKKLNIKLPEEVMKEAEKVSGGIK